MFGEKMMFRGKMKLLNISYKLTSKHHNIKMGRGLYG